MLLKAWHLSWCVPRTLVPGWLLLLLWEYLPSALHGQAVTCCRAWTFLFEAEAETVSLTRCHNEFTLSNSIVRLRQGQPRKAFWRWCT